MPLVEFFLAHYNKKFRKTVQGMSEETRRLLLNYDWPGNVRELKNALERAMILEEGNQLRPDDLPFSVASGTGRRDAVGEQAGLLRSETQLGSGKAPLAAAIRFPEGGTSLEDVEHALVELALQQSHGNQIKAAKLLEHQPGRACVTR